MINIPLINIVKNFPRLLITMFVDKVLLNPCDDVILERPFDQLVEDIGGNEFINIGTRKVLRKWLDMIPMSKWTGSPS